MALPFVLNRYRFHLLVLVERLVLAIVEKAIHWIFFVRFIGFDLIENLIYLFYLYNKYIKNNHMKHGHRIYISTQFRLKYQKTY